MELIGVPGDIDNLPLAPESRGKRWREKASSFRRREGSGTFLAGLLLFCVMAGAALAAPLITDHDPSRNNITARLVPPSWDWSLTERDPKAFPLGTDGLGRDMLSRILYGLRVSLLLAFAGLCLSMALGVTIGMISGVFGGRVDAILMRLVDLQLAFPYIVLAMAIVAATKTSIPILIVLLGLAGWVYFARVVRGVVLQEMQRDYVRSAQVLGASRWRIGLRYVLPNVLPAIAIIATLQFPGLIIFEATLSFLGLGIQPPTPSLG
ncbi:MAG: ABC transporter permease, partial [Thermomicrobiales bacterium]|nr:ABC transporter permease [Thermomicrobiales bacterium]